MTTVVGAGSREGQAPVGGTSTRGPGVRTVRFGPLSIEYDERVLRPRPWTKRQSLWAADLLACAPPGPVLELCCGAGQIGLLAVAASQRRLVAVDADPVACDYTRRNAAAAAIADRVEVREADLASAVAPGESFALVVADPPYLRSEETSRYPDDPLRAVDGGPDGLSVIWACLDVIGDCLAPGGSAVLQLRGADQVERVRDRLAEQGELVLRQYRSVGHGVLVRLDRS